MTTKYHDEGKYEGLKEGLEQGRSFEKAETARKMKADGMPVELIAKYTGLTVEEVDRL